MGALGKIAIFVVVAAMVTVAAITAAFAFWSIVPVQPGTATALAILFLVAPGLGIAAGVFAAARDHTRLRPGPRRLLVAAGALVGGLFGFGLSKATIDLVYTQRWENPASAPAWIDAAPLVAAMAMAVLAGLAVLVAGAARASPGPPDLPS